MLDEALEPIVLTDGNGQPGGRIKDGDYVIFYDIRGEREVQLFVTHAVQRDSRRRRKAAVSAALEEGLQADEALFEALRDLRRELARERRRARPSAEAAQDMLGAMSATLAVALDAPAQVDGEESSLSYWSMFQLLRRRGVTYAMCGKGHLYSWEAYTGLFMHS